MVCTYNASCTLMSLVRGVQRYIHLVLYYETGRARRKGILLQGTTLQHIIFDDRKTFNDMNK